MTEQEIADFRARLVELQAQLRIDGALDPDASRTVVLDQQSVGRLSRMDAMQQQAMARATQARRSASLQKITKTLARMDEGEFGYCSVTGDPISLKRLDARPIATMSLEAQERHERKEKVHRDD